MLLHFSIMSDSSFSEYGEKPVDSKLIEILGILMTGLAVDLGRC